MGNILKQLQQPFDKASINDLPIVRYEGDICLVRDEETLEEAIYALRGERVLGFDTETRPAFKKGNSYLPALGQFATADTVYLVQFSAVPFGGALAQVLSDPLIIKTGVAIRDDMRALQKMHSFEPMGLLDLGEIAVKYRMQTRGLRTLAANLMGVRISKSAQCSNWGAPRLSRHQIAYAATDAWISRELFLAFERLDLID